MGRRLIEVMQVLVDQIHQGGYQHRVLENSIYEESQKRIAAEKDRDHWKQARDTAIEGGELLLQSNQTLQAEIETLRTQLADAKRAASDEFTERQVLTVEQQQDAAAWQQQLATVRAENETLRQQLADAEHPPAMAQQRDEIAYLRTRLDEERSVSAGLRQQLDAAQAAVTLQRTRIERQRRVVDKVRQMLFKPNRDILYGDINGLRAAIAELDAGAEPTPVAEPLDAEGGA